MRTAIVSGALANKPGNGGNAWTRLSWVRGLEQLGFQVFFVEQSYGPNQEPYFDSVMNQFGLATRSLLLDAGGHRLSGLSVVEFVDVATTADLLFNISGHLGWEPIKQAPRRRVYYDDDPGYTQFWGDAARTSGHDFYFTIGQNIGTPACCIPTCGILWRHTRSPVVLDDWAVSSHRAPDRFTTIASWRGAYGPVEKNGKRFGLKAHEFRKFIELPQRAPQAFEIALSIHPADRQDLDALIEHQWRIADPLEAAGTPEGFHRYVQCSGAEFSVAQGIYVETNSGWFSDRTTRYLASGEPALVQDTGFSKHLPVGEGLLAFRTMEEAVAGAEQISRDYPRHAAAARAIAEEFFDARRIVTEVLEQVL